MKTLITGSLGGHFHIHSAGFRALAITLLSSSILIPSPGLGQTGCAPIQDGLVSWWRAEGDATDVLGVNNGQALFGLTYVPGKVGTAFSFNGDHTRVSV